MVKFKFADIGEGLTEGTVGDIKIKVGDKVKDGDEMFSVETDKVNTEIFAPCNGVITAINMKPGDIITVGQVVVEIDDGNANQPSTPETVKSKENPNQLEAAASVVGSVPVSNDVIAMPKISTASQPLPNAKVLATPLVRRIAFDQKIDLTTIKGSGPNGRIMKIDLQQVQENKNLPGQVVNAQKDNNNLSVSNTIREENMPPIRKAIAKQMVLSKTTIPHVTLMKTANVMKLNDLRIQIKTEAEKQNIKVTYLPFFMKACAIALKEYPILNSSYEEEKGQILFKEFYNIGMATDTPKGLMVPVIKNVDKMSILQIASAIGDLSQRTREQKIKAEELKGASFTITNFGSAGVEFATPIINFPETAILGVGIIEKKPVVNKNNEIEIGMLLPLSLSIDHRLIDGADGGRFLVRVTELLESPLLLLI